MADNFNEIINEGVQIYGSRERIREQLTGYAQKYLGLQNVDLYKTSLVSYLIDCLSILSANHMFYDSVIYKEFFMVDAQMSESVYNLAKWIGYNPPLATPAKVDVMFTVPLTFQSAFATFNIPSTFKVTASNIPYIIDSVNRRVSAAQFSLNKLQTSSNEIFGKIINNSSLTVKDSNGAFKPVYLDNTNKKVSFMLPFVQEERFVSKFQVPYSLEPFQFFSKLLDFNGMVSDIEVYISEPKANSTIDISEIEANDDFDPTVPPSNGKQWILWNRSEHGIYTMSTNASEYVFTGGNNKGEFFFGNGIVGKQPAKGSVVVVIMYLTKGASGTIIPNSITNHDSLIYEVGSRLDAQGNYLENPVFKKYNIEFSTMNPGKSVGGSDIPSLPEIKRNAIVNLRSKGKLVSEDDYNDINTIMGESFPSTEAYPILKRSDIKVNEIMAFMRLSYHDANADSQIVPTRNIKFLLYDPVFVDSQYTVFRGTKTSVDSIWRETVAGNRVNYKVPSLLQADPEKYDVAGHVDAGGKTALERGFAELSGKSYETLFNMTIDQKTMMAYYDYACMNIHGLAATLYDNSASDPYLTQFAYIPVTGVDFNIEFDSVNGSTDSSSSSSSNSDGIAKLSIGVNVNNVYSSDITEFRSKMITKWDNNQEYYTTEANAEKRVKKDENNSSIEYEEYVKFNFEIPNYLSVPIGMQRFEFAIEGMAQVRDQETHRLLRDSNNDVVVDWQTIGKYFVDVTIRQDLSDTMFSSVTKTNTWEGSVHNYYRYEIHNVPVILSDYLSNTQESGILQRADNQTIQNFELTVLQKLVNSINMESRRMLTDSINIKFCDTYGALNNLKYIQPDYIVRSRFKTPMMSSENLIPKNIIFSTTFDPLETTDPLKDYRNSTSRFIVNGPANSVISDEFIAYDNVRVSEYLNYIAERLPSGSWYFIPPSQGMYIMVMDELDLYEKEKILVYTGSKWKDVQEFQIPLQIYAKVQISKNSTTTSEQIITNIKTALMSYFLPKMGIHKSLDRSEIVSVIRGVASVNYCELIEPEVDIKFDYDIKTLTKEELIDYTPQYTGFNEQTIKIEVI